MEEHTSLLQLPPLSLYVHIPWCVRKCPYCDFNSHAQPDQGIDEQAYLDALFRDLEQELPGVWGRTVETVFIGGGTPSLFSADGIAKLLSGLRARLPLRPDAEITMEANPGTFEQDRFKGFREAGINRLSIGIQSFQDEHLQALGRIHGAADAHRAVDIARRAGFDNFNLDLMYALPGSDAPQTLDGAMADLDAALSHAPPHLSWYQLTLEPNTLFHAKPPQVPDEERLADMEEAGFAKLQTAGMNRYEVSAFSREGKRCRHNLNYWGFGDYLGIGAGAHGKITDGATSTIRRNWKHRSPKDYLSRPDPVGETRILDPGDLQFEFMLNVLRLTEGVPEHWFEARTGLPLAQIQPILSQAEGQGLLTADSSRIQSSDFGLRFLNDLQQRFLGKL